MKCLYIYIHICIYKYMYDYVNIYMQRCLRVRMMNSSLAPASHLLLRKPAADVCNFE